MLRKKLKDSKDNSHSLTLTFNDEEFEGFAL